MSRTLREIKSYKRRLAKANLNAWLIKIGKKPTMRNRIKYRLMFAAYG